MAKKAKAEPIVEGTPTTAVIPDDQRGTVVTRQDASFIAGSTDYSYWQTDRGLPQTIDEVERRVGLDIYDRMRAEPTMEGIERGFKMLCLADGWHLEPALAKPKDSDPPDKVTDYERAVEIQEYVQAVVDRLDRMDPLLSFGVTVENLLDAARLGHKLAELTFDVIEDGPYAGKLGLSAFRCKPRQNYAFVMDEFNGFRGVSAKVPGGSMLVWTGLMGDASLQPNTIAPDKIVIFLLQSVDGDPRGRSWWRACYDPWFRKQGTKPQEAKTVYQFGGGSADVFLPEEKIGVPVKDPDTGQEVSLAKREERIMSQSQNGGARIHPFGTLVQWNRPEGTAFDGYVTLYGMHDREMVLAFYATSRAFLEAQHGSSRDSADAQDILDELKKYVRRRLSETIQSQVFYRLVKGSFDEATAEKFTPKFAMGVARSGDFSKNAPGAAALYASGGLTDPEWKQVMQQHLNIEPEDGEKVGGPAVPVVAPGDPAAGDPGDPSPPAPLPPKGEGGSKEKMSRAKARGRFQLARDFPGRGRADRR